MDRQELNASRFYGGEPDAAFIAAWDDVDDIPEELRKEWEKE